MDWINIDTTMPDNGQVIRVLHEDKTEDIAKCINGEIYVYDVVEVKNITHWKPTSPNR